MERQYKAFIDDGQGRLKAVLCVLIRLEKNAQGTWDKIEVPDSEFEIQADLALLAIGFTRPRHQGMLEQLDLQKDARGNVQATTEGDQAYRTTIPGIYTAGDMRRGQSLVVWAIREGRQAAQAIDQDLMGKSGLPR